MPDLCALLFSRGLATSGQVHRAIQTLEQADAASTSSRILGALGYAYGIANDQTALSGILWRLGEVVEDPQTPPGPRPDYVSKVDAATVYNRYG